jgi:hypothetical protein
MQSQDAGDMSLRKAGEPPGLLETFGDLAALD